MVFSTISSFGVSDIFSLLIIFTVIYVTRYYYNYFTRPNPLPGPFPLPILGNAHQIACSTEFIEWMMLMHKKYGDMYEIYFASQRTIVLCRADLIENMNVPSTKTIYPFRVLVTEGYAEYGIDGTGIVNNTNFDTWKYSRQFFTQAMMTPRFNHQAIEWTLELWEEMELYWNNLGVDKELDLIRWMHRFTNEIIFKISTGVKNYSVASYYSSLTPEIILGEEEKKTIEESENFIKSIEVFMDGTIYFVIFNKFIRHYVPFIRGKIKSLLKNRDYLFNRIHDVIKERRVEIENTPLDQPLRHDMLTSFITANTSRDISNVKHTDADLLRPMTDKEIFGDILDAMRGGTDTTANLFCFIIYYLAHYPEVKRRFLQELETVLGKDLTKPVTFKDLDELHYCDAVIKEVYRLGPVGFSIGRVNVEKDEVGGFSWPERTSFEMFHYGIMNHKDYWTDPETFDPDRFYMIEKSDKYLLEKQHVKNSFYLFGGGIRICPGRKLAMIELKCLLSSIYRKYDIEMADINAPLKRKFGFLAACKELIVKVKPRKL